MERVAVLAAEPDVLAVFVPPWTRVDSASELCDPRDAHNALCAARDCDTCTTPQDRTTLAQLRRAALAAGGTLGKASFATDRLLQSGGFGRVSLVRVEGVDAPLALKTVCRALRPEVLSARGVGRLSRFVYGITRPRLTHAARTQVELHTQEDPSKCGSPKFSNLDPRRVRRLQQEVALYSAVAPARCPLLPTLFDAGLYASGRRAYLAMSYVPGTDLRCRLAASDRGRLPVAVARFFAAEVLLALQVIHDCGFVYRDVKPENVMVNETTAHCVLVDFDLAIRRPDGDELAQWDDTPLDEAALAAAAFEATAPAEVSPPTSRRGSLEADASADGAAPAQAATAAPPVAGTAEYAAPEVLGGAVHGAAADTWQVGVLLYEMLFGATPFAGKGSKARGASNAGVPTTGELLFSSNDLVFRRIRGAALVFPQPLPEEDTAEEARLCSAAVDLLTAMLRRTAAPSDPRVRLGGIREGDVRRHPFFAGLDWEALPHAPAPVTIQPVRLTGSQINLADMARGLED